MQLVTLTLAFVGYILAPLLSSTPSFLKNIAVNTYELVAREMD